MKILLVGFKLSVGNELYMKTLIDNISEKGVNVSGCGDKNYSDNQLNYTCIGKGGSGIEMFIDTLNPLNWYRFIKKISGKEYDVIFYISSHTLNLITIIISRILSKSTIISHIHDPYPHSGSRFSGVILFSNKTQAKLSDKIVVYGKKLKEIVSKGYGIEQNKIINITHGVYRKDKDNYKKSVKKKYVSMLGRIERYKGVDIFLKASMKLLDEDYDKYSGIIFVVGGAGDIKPYNDVIEKYPNKENLLIINKRLTDKEFDDTLISSYLLALPYYDGTQTGNIQVAYYNACPVIATKVGGLPELIDENMTGLLINPGNVNELAKAIDQMITNYNNVSYQENCFKYYRDNLKWSNISDKLLSEFAK